MLNKRMTKLSLLVLLLAVTIACGNKKSTPPVVEAPPVATVPDTPEVTPIPHGLEAFPEIAKETNKQTLIAKLAEKEMVYEQAVGFAGAYTETYAAYERLLQLLSTDEWAALAQHASPAVRAYTLKALQDRRETKAQEARLQLKSDQTPVKWFSGCIISEVPVSFFLSRQ